MHRTTTNSIVRAILLSLLLVGAEVPNAIAQGQHQHGQGATRMLLSATADFSTNDHVFHTGDSVYVLLRAPGLDVASIVENELIVEPRDAGDPYAGVLTNHFDGTFTAAIAVDDLDTTSVAWQITATLTDAADNTVEGRSHFVVGTRHREMHAYRIHGLLELVGDGYILVGGERVRVTSRTQLRSSSGAILSLDLLLNQRVTVLVQQTPDGPVALLITLYDVSDDALLIEGSITALSDTSVTVDSLEILVDSETEVSWRASVMDLSFLQIGMGIRVHAEAMEDGAFYAPRIEVTSLSEIEIVVRGEITGIDGNQISVGETSFTVNANTRIIGVHGERPDLEDLQVGDFVTAVLISDGTEGYLAIVVLTDRDQPRWGFGVTGRIDSLGADYVAVGGYRFSVTAETEITDSHGHGIPFASLEAGHVVRVRARNQSDSTWVAEEIRLQARVHEHGRMLGTVTAVSEGELVVDGVSFQLAALTRYRGGLLSSDDLASGQYVLVHYLTLADDTRLALMVAARQDPPASIVLRGAIDTVRVESIVVMGTEVWLTNETLIIGEDGIPAPAEELAEGQYVAVHARSAGGGLEAVRIRIVPSLVINAPVESFGSGQLRLGGRMILVTDETLIVGTDNVVLAESALQSGAVVEVVAAYGEDESTAGTLVADRVLVTGSATTTDVEEKETAGLPGAFVLEQNYPNPFNPNTTIAFTINGARPVRAMLTVFNVLGQRVATLVNGTLEPGVHEVRWNAVDEGGSRVSSGIYLYRLEVDGAAETRSMILLK